MHVVYAMTTTAAEAVELIKDLAEIVKLQQTTQTTQQFEATTQLQQLTDILHDLSQVIKTTQTKPILEPRHWLTFVKQQCHRDVYAYDALLDAEKKHFPACLGPDQISRKHLLMISSSITKHAWARSE